MDSPSNPNNAIMNNDVIIASKLRKKKTRGNAWSDRFFKLKGNMLEYYVRSGDLVRTHLQDPEKK
jgi:hypothetical protein